MTDSSLVGKNSLTTANLANVVAFAATVTVVSLTTENSLTTRLTQTYEESLAGTSGPIARSKQMPDLPFGKLGKMGQAKSSRPNVLSL